MRCPYCGSEDLKVADSRNVEGAIKRRRECLGCHRRFNTYERIQTGILLVLKKDGRREEFNHDKLALGIRKACTKRPVSYEAVEKIVDDIEAELRTTGRAEVPSSLIGERVMEHLKGLDHIAYIRFASVYRQFADLDEVRREIDALRGSKEPQPLTQLPLMPPEDMIALGSPKEKRRRTRKAGAAPSRRNGDSVPSMDSGRRLSPSKDDVLTLSKEGEPYGQLHPQGKG
ncbi:MAG: transcriptional regulator NrdR [Chloroflexota bacterium]|nr:transcriptional regulator NrdR [Chloroflexota bacterium]